MGSVEKQKTLSFLLTLACYAWIQLELFVLEKYQSNLEQLKLIFYLKIIPTYLTGVSQE